MYRLGIDIGATSVKLAALSPEEAMLWRSCEMHRGAPRTCLRRQLAALDAELGLDACGAWRMTGSGASSLAGSAAASVLADVPAIVAGVRRLVPTARSIVAIGGQGAYFITGFAEGGVPRFAQNESCAAGTGSFFEDQMNRLGLNIEDYSELVAGARSVPRLSGRCAVFAKTDIIHRQQEGVDVRDILLGLCYALVRSYKATIVRGLPVEPPLALAGGIVRNGGMERAVRDVFKLGHDDLIVNEMLAFAQPIGAALTAREGDGEPLADLVASLGHDVADDDLVRLAPLATYPYEPGCGYRVKPQPWATESDGRIPCYLGIDVGSTSTNLVLVDEQGNLLDAQYLRTRGDAENAVRGGLSSLGKRLGNRAHVLACATTGSGRERMGKLVGADIVRDEITAQARAAVAADGKVDTVFEIGGQDSKFIALENGNVADFQMNKICAAGTGSFVEEQASRLGVPLSDYGALALSAKRPVDLGERCTVFVETAINAALAKGAGLDDITAGLAYSIVRNYLHKVVGAKHVGNRIVLQGGVAFNPAIVAAFASFYGERLTVSPWFAVSGAVGAALLASEAYESGDVLETRFRGFELAGALHAREAADPAEITRNLKFFEKTRDALTAGYTGLRDPSKQTVGIPRALLMQKFFALANAYFKELGYNVLFTDDTDEETVELSQESAQGEVCYPVKLLHGHLRKLLAQEVDYIFMPSVHTIRHAKSHVPHNFACPYMQAAPAMAARGLDFEGHGVKLLSPELDLDMGQEGMAAAMLDVGLQLGATPHASARALMAGGFAVQQLDATTEALGDELLASIEPGERVIVLLTRQYGAYDGVLNMGIPQELIRRGHKVAVLSNLRAHNMDVGPDHPGLCWPFGQHLVSGAKIIRRDPRLFMVYLTNHGCGPDTMMTHIIAEEMDGKPFLHIEVDEHSSKVGVVTRIEAFLNAIDHYEAPSSDALLPLYTKNYRGVNAPLAHDGRVVCLPDYGIHARLLAERLRARDFDVRLMAPDAEALSCGHDVDTTKEYLSFTSLAGMCLKAARTTHGEERLRLVIPSSVGAEPEAVYDDVIRGLLDARGYSDVLISAFQLERLPWSVSDPQALFDVLLAGDELESKRTAVDSARAESTADAPRIAVVGEWPLVYSDSLANGLYGMLVARGARVYRMPLAEYMLFLWYDCIEDDRHERSNAPMPIDGGKAKPVFGFDPTGAHPEAGNCAAAGCDTAIHASMGVPVSVGVDAGDPEKVYQARKTMLDGFRAQMENASERLGAASPYSDFDALRTAGDKLMGNYRGANGRYRAAKIHAMARRVSGIIQVASLYENTQLILTLNTRENGIPALTLQFDGALDQSLEERVDTFLYYLTQTGK